MFGLGRCAGAVVVGTGFVDCDLESREGVEEASEAELESSVESPPILDRSEATGASSFLLAEDQIGSKSKRE